MQPSRRMGEEINLGSVSHSTFFHLTICQIPVKGVRGGSHQQAISGRRHSKMKTAQIGAVQSSCAIATVLGPRTEQVLGEQSSQGATWSAPSPMKLAARGSEAEPGGKLRLIKSQTTGSVISQPLGSCSGCSHHHHSSEHPLLRQAVFIYSGLV